MIDSPLSSFSKKDVESFEHLLFQCTLIEGFLESLHILSYK